MGVDLLSQSILTAPRNLCLPLHLLSSQSDSVDEIDRKVHTAFLGVSGKRSGDDGVAARPSLARKLFMIVKLQLSTNKMGAWMTGEPKAARCTRYDRCKLQASAVVKRNMYR